MALLRKAINSRWLGWLFAGFNLALMGTGLALQVATESPMFGAPFLVHFSEVLGLCGFAVIGALIVSRHPRHPVGWIWLLVSFSFGVDHFAWGYAYYGSIAYPGSLPGVAAMIIWKYWSGRGTLGLLGFTLLFLLFPTGRPLSRRWGILAWIAVGRVVVWIPVSALAPHPFGYFPFPTDLLAAGDTAQAVLGPLRLILVLVVLLCVLGAMLSLFIRLRRARGVERQQLKWFVYAAAFLPPAFIIIALSALSNPTLPLGPIIGITAGFGMSTASAIAIFRYRLWDIDIIIRRTLIFGLLTVALALVYFSSVVLLGQVFQTLTGQQSPLAIVLSTLAIAALFSPLRRRIQNVIDRRFYRRKYDAEKTLANFATVTRDQIDLNELTTMLLRIVQETMQPDHLSLWLKERS